MTTDRLSAVTFLYHLPKFEDMLVNSIVMCYSVLVTKTSVFILRTHGITEDTMKVAVLGFGTVGFGVYEMLKTASGLETGPVLVRKGKDDEPFKVSDISDIVSDGSIGAVAEVMGGVDPAYEYACAVIRAGKHFVTSNKALVAAKGPELAKMAAEAGVSFLFSAACGGGVPFLHNLSLAAESDSIESVGGILNGTTNYMLDAMQRRGMTYEEALSDAQALGYAEADPTADVTGLDALRKIMLACAVAFGSMPVDGLDNEGIDSFTAQDVEFFGKKGLTCRLIVSGAPLAGGGVSAFVEPVLFNSEAPECSVLKNYNMAKYTGKCSGPILFTGQGAGRWQTASAVVRDLSDILSGRRFMMDPDVKCVSVDNSCVERKYCVRVSPDICIPFASVCEEDFEGSRYIFTEAVKVSEMHAFAKKVRKDGAKIFFAAMGQE